MALEPRSRPYRTYRGASDVPRTALSMSTPGGYWLAAHHPQDAKQHECQPKVLATKRRFWLAYFAVIHNLSRLCRYKEEDTTYGSTLRSLLFWFYCSSRPCSFYVTAPCSRHSWPGRLTPPTCEVEVETRPHCKDSSDLYRSLASSATTPG